VVARSTTLCTSLARSAWRDARWLVVAPHADDETLGVGGLIAQVARTHRLGAVVYLTDGAGSHPHEDERSRRALTAMRRQEATLSLRRLTSSRQPVPVFLDWPDATPHPSGSHDFEAARRRLAGLCRRGRIDAIAVTASHEPHCDHVAAFDLAAAVAGSSGLGHMALFEYVVWAPQPPRRPNRVVQTNAMPKGLRTLALNAHRSQIGPAFGEGFRLPLWQLRMADRDRLYLRKARHVVG
jgi:N-acetylglucosamine malate deacetylase 1